MILRLVGDLELNGLAPSSRGRLAHSISVIGVDLGGTNLRLAVAEESGVIRTKRCFRLAAIREKEKDGVVHFLRQEIRRLLESEAGSVGVVAIGVPGLVKEDGISVHQVVNLPELEGLDLRASLELPNEVNVLVDNDLNMAALGEISAGSSVGCRHLAFVGSGTGLGLGIVANGEIYRGWRNAAGELGSVLVPIFSAEPSKEPTLVRLETIVSGSGIEQMWLEHTGESLTAKEVFQLARRGNVDACSVVERYLLYFRLALANIACLFSPEKIVIGGGTAGSLLPYLEGFRSFLDKAVPQAPELGLTSLGDSAGLVGAIHAGLKVAHRLATK